MTDEELLRVLYKLSSAINRMESKLFTYAERQSYQMDELRDVYLTLSKVTKRLKGSK